jgi:hypothetical protein
MTRQETNPTITAWIAPALCGVALLSSCGGDQGDPDGDDRRGKAQPISIGQVVTDKVTAPLDVVDWKLIEVPGRGILTVNVFWDQNNVDSVVALADKFGQILQERPRDSRAPQDQIIIQAREAGFFFIKVTVGRGESVYSVQSSFQAGGGLDDIELEPIPEFVRPIEVGTEGEQVGAAGGGGGGGGGGAAAAAPAALPPLASPLAPSPGFAPTPVGFAPAPPTQNNPAPARVVLTDLVPDFNGAYNAVEGQILRVIPRGEGGSEITIGIGSSQGVAQNHVGEVIMPNGNRLEGGRFIVTQSFKLSAKAQTNAPANMVNAAAKIIVKVPR